MKLVLFGATGMIGSRILAEALRRGHAVTVAARDPGKVKAPAPGKGSVSVVKGDALDAASVAEAARGQDAVLSAIGPGPTGDLSHVPRSIAALVEGTKRSGTKRLLIVGGAGSLEVAPGKKLIDSPHFPKEWLGIAKAHADALDSLRAVTAVDWTYVSPPALIQPGERTGKFRLGADQLVADAKGESRISAEDYAVAFLDETEKPRHIRQRFTLAY